MTDQIDKESLKLFGQIVEANVAQAAHVTNQMLGYKEEQIRDLAKTIVQLSDVLNEATVIDRATERRLWDFKSDIAWARQILRDMEAVQ